MKLVTALLLTLAVVATPAALAAEKTEYSLRELVEGVAVSKKARLAVRDITLGDRSIRSLFDLSSHADKRYARYVGRSDRLTLKLRGRDAMSELRLLLLNGAVTQIAIHLSDQGFLARGYEKLPKAILPTLDVEDTLILSIAVEMTPCERVTRIVYREVDAILQEQLVRAAQTGEPVTLDDVFERLVKGTLKDYLDALPPSTHDDPCFTTYGLLKWVRSEEARGFAFSEYTITPELKGILQVLAEAIAKVRSAQRYQLQVDIVGFTDDVAFKRNSHLPVRAHSTGVPQLRDPLAIFYGGCTVDYAVRGKNHFVTFSGAGAISVGTTIENNCELGAARAYVASSAMSTMLGSRASYRYATGGVAASGAKATAAEKRKIAIRILAQTATTE